MAKTSKLILFLFFISASISWAKSARVLLDELEDQPRVVSQLANPATFAIPGPSAWIPAAGPGSALEEGGAIEPPADVATPDDDVGVPVDISIDDDVAPNASPTVTPATSIADVETPGDVAATPESSTNVTTPNDKVVVPGATPTDDDVAPNTSPTATSPISNDDVETPGDDLNAPEPPPIDVATPNDDVNTPIATYDVAPNSSPTPPDDMVTPRDDVAAPISTPTNNDVAPKPVPTATSATPVAAAATGAQPSPHDPTLSFFMHDIFGGSHPSTRVVTGLIANSKVSPIPFSKPNNNLFPHQGGTALLTGLTGAQSTTIIPNSGNANNLLSNKNQPFVTAGQLSAGSIQNLMFGAITVFDDELTEGHELGSSVIGKAQGFYLVSSIDGTSHTIAFSVILHGDREIGNTISFFGVHRTATAESHIAVVGGTGKYENSGGYAAVETIRPEYQYLTDGVDTILNFNVFLTQ